MRGLAALLLYVETSMKALLNEFLAGGQTGCCVSLSLASGNLGWDLSYKGQSSNSGMDIAVTTSLELS